MIRLLINPSHKPYGKKAFVRILSHATNPVQYDIAVMQTELIGILYLK